MEKKSFLAAVSELGNQRGLTKEVIADAICEAFQLSLNKKFEDEYKVLGRFSKSVKKNDKNLLKDKEVVKLPSALIRVACDLDRGTLNVYHQFKVLNDDDIQDDFLEISLEEAQKVNPNLQVGDIYEEEVNLSDLTKKDVDRFISNFKQKISKAEKSALLDIYKDKIGSIVTGSVEKADSNSVLLNLGRTSITLYKRDLIGDEGNFLRPGDPLKVYISDIGKGDKKSSLIHASRSCEEFLQKLFESEVNEIADGTVVIKDIARMSGKRSKVVVYSNDPNVDASGACIGKNGERIQRIVNQLGNSKESKEKVDVVLYHRNLGVYLSEILKPGEILGINFGEDDKTALVICKNDTMKLAVGLKGQNISLARKLTHLENIKVINDYDMEKEGVTSYKPIEEYIAEDEEAEKEEARKRFREESIRHAKAKENTESIIDHEVLIDSNKGEEQEVTINLNEDDSTIVEEKQAEELLNDDTPIEEKKEETEKSISEISNAEETKVEIVKEKKETPVEHREVKTTTTLESLEKSLEEEKKSKSESKNKKANKKKIDKVAKEESDEVKKPIKKMDIYTEEELRELDDEENENDYYDDEEDWSEYDNDDFYEDK